MYIIFPNTLIFINDENKEAAPEIFFNVYCSQKMQKKARVVVLDCSKKISHVT